MTRRGTRSSDGAVLEARVGDEGVRRPGRGRRRELRRSPSGRSSRSSGPTAPARPRSSTCSPASTGRPRGASSSRAGTSPTSRPDRIIARGMARTFQNIRLFATMSALENVLVGQHARMQRGPVPLDPADAGGAPRGARGAREGAASCSTTSASRPTSSTRWRRTSPTATSAGSRSPGRSPRTRSCSCSTSPRPA